MFTGARRPVRERGRPRGTRAARRERRAPSSRAPPHDSPGGEAGGLGSADDSRAVGHGAARARARRDQGRAAVDPRTLGAAHQRGAARGGPRGARRSSQLPRPGHRPRADSHDAPEYLLRRANFRPAAPGGGGHPCEAPRADRGPQPGTPCARARARGTEERRTAARHGGRRAQAWVTEEDPARRAQPRGAEPCPARAISGDRRGAQPETPRAAQSQRRRDQPHAPRVEQGSSRGSEPTAARGVPQAPGGTGSREAGAAKRSGRASPGTCRS